jgi:transposase
MLYVGIDWSDKDHCVFVTDDSAESLLAFRFEHSAPGLAELQRQLAQHDSDPTAILCAIELKSGLLVHSLLRCAYQVYHIPPKALSRYRERHHPSGAKTDSIDARALAHALRTDRQRYNPLQPLDPLAAQIVELSVLRDRLTQSRVRLLNQLTAALKAYYPVALKLFSGPDRQITQALLRRWPTPDALRAVSWPEWQAFLSERRYPAASGQRLYARMQEPQLAAAEPVVQTYPLWVLNTLDHLAVADRDLAMVGERLQQAFARHDRSRLFASLPGASHVLAPKLLRFFAISTAPVPRTSGKTGPVRMRKACQREFQTAMHQFAFLSTKQSTWAREYYARHRSQGDSHNTTLRKLGHIWIRIIVAMIRTGRPYDEAIHQANRKRWPRG